MQSLSKHLGDTQVTDFDETALSEEDILALKISVDDLTIMDVFHSETDLSKPVQNLILTERSTTLVLYSLLQITTCEKSLKVSQVNGDVRIARTVTVVHDDAQLASLSFENFDKCYDVWMTECL